MWLIDTTTLELQTFQIVPVDTYAILSHVWGSNAEELDFDEFKAGKGRQKVGFYKIQKCCQQAKNDGLQYAWVDTCCIDKRSSTELSEAINSMFAWYQNAKVCYAYLSDVYQYDPLSAHDDARSFKNSRWFTRGWTLQELIAPQTVCFYTHHWERFGDKKELAREIHAITGINQGVLAATHDFLDCSIAERMSWASGRQTTRLEDTAYCLLGLFRANMPLLYGEGAQAFIRLQEAIILETDDESIFAWTGVDEGGTGLLASSPAFFSKSFDIHRRTGGGRNRPYTKTNRGLSIECQVLPCAMNTYVVPLRCEQRQANLDAQEIVIFLCLTSEDGQYRRIPFEGQCIDIASKWDISKSRTLDVFVPNDGRTLELAPHSGLPLVHIQSNLVSTWYFPESELSPQQSQGAHSRIAVTEDLEHGVTGHENAEAQIVLQSSWEPRKTECVQFLPKAMETGIVVAFSKSNSPTGRFHSYMEIGFDMHFRPICILHTSQFRLRDKPSGSRRLRVCESFWMPKDNKTNRRTQKLEGHRQGRTRISYHGWLKALRYGPLRVLVLFLIGVRHDYLDHIPYTWDTEGHRRRGLRLLINDQLPAQYGCTNIQLEFRHVRGLEWQVQFREMPFHSEPHQPRICWQRLIYARKRLINDWFMFVFWLGMIILVFWTFSFYGGTDDTHAVTTFTLFMCVLCLQMLPLVHKTSIFRGGFNRSRRPAYLNHDTS